MTLEERRESKKISNRKYRENNREKAAQYAKEYRANHLQYYKDYDKNYQKEKFTGTFEKKVAKLLIQARCRAKRKGVRFSITEKDLDKVDACLLSEVPLDFSVKRKAAPNSPTIDRIDPRLGYVPGNVQVISSRANRIKNDATFEEFEKIYLNWKKLEKERNAKRGKQLCLFDEPAGPGSST
jgi:hypothetical protein